MDPRPKPRSPATLASWLNKVLSAALPHLPPLTELAAALRTEVLWDHSALEAALGDLHDRLTGLPLEGVLDAPPTPRGAETLLAQLPLLRVAGARVQSEALAFLHGTSIPAATARPVLASYEIDFRALEKLVERSIRWLDEMDIAIRRRRVSADADVSREALEAFAGRAIELRERHRLLLDACNSARNVHALADQLLGTRASLVEAVRTKVLRALEAFDHRIAAACIGDPDGPVPSWKSVVAARSDVQMWVAQAVALVIRLQTAQERFERESAALRRRSVLVAQARRDLERGHATLALDARQDGLMPKVVWGDADTQSPALA